LPYIAHDFSRRLRASVALVALLGLAAASPSPPADQVRIAWHAPAKGTQLGGLSTVQDNATFPMPGWLRTAAGHRADPVYVVEDRTRTYTAPQSAATVYVDDAFARHHGGPNNTDTTVKRRSRKQIVPFDASGRYSYEPFLCKDEPPLNDANPNPTQFTACSPAGAPSDERFQDPGDAALAEFPAGMVQIGQSWTFSRMVAVGREQGSGTMDYVDTLQRIDERGRQRVAVIDVSATGRITPPADVQARGFHTATMTFGGTAEFDLDQGTPGAAHYTGRVEWHTSLMGVSVGEILDEIYDAKPWTPGPAKP
jgi:hypothetical protein